MATLEKAIGGVVAILAIVIVLWTVLSHQGVKAGSVTFQQGQIQTDAFIFLNGFSAGSTQQFNVDSSGNVTTSGTLATGAVSGTTGTFTGIGKFGSAASSTVQIGAASKAGCIILGDSADGASVVYITATGSTITASTTKPAACQAAS